MKSLIAAIVAISLPFGFTAAAWSSESPSIQTERSDAASLGTQELEMDTQNGIDAEQLDRLSTQINQEVNGDQEDSGPSFLNQVLNLPPGMVVRGTSFGGLAVGSEF